MEKILNAILERLASDSEDCYRKDNIDRCYIKKDNVKELTLENSDKTVVFIDGGNAELISAPNFSLHFLRIFSVTFKGNKRISTEKKECYSFTHSYSDNGNLKYNVTLFPELRSFVFDPSEPSLKQGDDVLSISAAGSLARRLLEIEFAKSYSGKADVIVLDGLLTAKFSFEKKFMKDLMLSLGNSWLVGFSKTSKDLTESGNSVTGVLQNISKDIKMPWFYSFGIFESLNTHFAKLNSYSKYIFKIESFNVSNDSELFSLLSLNSNDFSFPGYPYGLLMADKFARVSNQEQEYLLNVFKAKAGNNWRKIEPHINSLNAHDVLDNIG